MKRFSMLLMLAAATMMSLASTARADEPAAATAENQDPNMRWHNNRWWYWQAGPQRWMLWDGSQWNYPAPRRVTRSYSYQPGTSGITSPGVRQRSSSPSSSGRINNSFGGRDAGAKTRGNY